MAADKEMVMTTVNAAEAAFPGFASELTQARHFLSVVVRGGEFRSADFVIPIPDNGLTIKGGLTEDAFIASPDGSNGLYGRPLPVPGGVTGVGALSRMLGSVGEVTARVEAVKPMKVHDLLAFELTLYLRIQVRSPFVGGECYLGTSDKPLTIRLQRTGWKEHIPKLRRDGIPDHVIAISDINLSAANFHVPAVSGAGPGGAFNMFVNSRAGLPNPGESTLLQVQAEAFLAQNPDCAKT